MAVINDPHLVILYKKLKKPWQMPQSKLNAAIFI